MNYHKSFQNFKGSAKEKKKWPKSIECLSFLDLDKPVQKSTDKIIMPDKDDDHFYANNNPLYVGTLMINIDTMTDELSCAVATFNHAMFGMAHLYNALHKLKMTTLRWPALERTMQLHPGPLFANDIPNTIDVMAKRIAYHLGTGASENTFTDKHAQEFPMAAASRIIQPFFLENAPLGRCIHFLEEQVQERERLRLLNAPPSTTSALAYQT